MPNNTDFIRNTIRFFSLGKKAMTAIFNVNFGVWGKFWPYFMNIIKDIAYYNMSFQRLANYLSNDA